MKIVVICENMPQFVEYVNAVLYSESGLAKRIVSRHGSSITVHIDDLEFIYCNKPLILKGRSFGKDDRIVRVGSWYNIPEEIQEDIVTEFMARTK